MEAYAVRKPARSHTGVSRELDLDPGWLDTQVSGLDCDAVQLSPVTIRTSDR